MRNFTQAFNRISKIFIVFYLLFGISISYSQNKPTAITNENLEKSSSEGTIYLGSKKSPVFNLDKTVISSKSGLLKTSKKAADTEAPVIICPPNQQLACGTLVPSYFPLLTVTDNIDTSIDITQFPGQGSDFYDGMEIKFTATDDAGNKSECSIIVTASSPDVTPPTFTCPTGLTLNCGDVIPNYATSPIMNLDDDCSIKLSYKMTPGPGTPFYDGIPIQIEYFDKPGNNGNKSVCNFIVKMATPDVISPVFEYCPGTQSLPCGSVLPDYRTLITASDNCLGSLTVSQSPDVGTAFTPGMTVTMTLKDAANNASTCSFVVNASADTTKPTITCLGSQSLSCGSVLPDYRSLISATDNCTSSPTVTQTPAAGSTFTNGMTVTMSATDASGNFQTCSFVVNASADTTKPTIACPGNQTLALGSLLPDYSNLVIVSDNCTGSPTITQTPSAGSTFTGGINVTLKATDASGNFSTCTFAVNPTGSDLPPTITCPSNMELYANSTLPDYVSFLPTVTDDFTDIFDLVFTQTPPQGTLFTADTDVTITAKDASGNIASCTFLVKLKTATVSIDCKTNSFNVSNLNGANGFTIYGEKLTRETGFSVNNAGDVNGDGINDLIIGAKGNYDPWYGTKKEYKIIKGAAYVVFGKSSGFAPNIDLGLLNGSNGFAVRNDNPSTNFPWTGYDVSSAGDINGDGIDDLMVSDPYRHSSYGVEIGHTYFIFGRNSGFPAEFNLSTLNGNNGFTLIGISNYESSGTSIASIGDINGDGYGDIAVITSGSGAINGKCYVIYGKSGGFPKVLRTNELNGTNGFTIEGNAPVGKIGRSVAGLGDVNGDGISDIGIGTYNDSGQVRKYIVFGRSSNFPAIFNISSLNGNNGFAIENSTSPLASYTGVAKAGDINNDGINDIAITGQYILFGRTVFPALFDLNNLDGTNGFTIKNASIGEKFGFAGDFNSDGIDDYFVQSSSDVTILFGKKNWTANADMHIEKKLNISFPYNSECSANFAGDINNDGVSDIIIGTAFKSYDLKINQNPGMSFVVFGKKTADTEKPTITNCPSDKILTKFDPIPDYTKDITVIDNCDTKPVITQLPVAGTVFDGTSQEIVLTVKDASGNESVCSFKINSSGADLPPEITCPGDQELYANSMLPDYVHFLSAVSDDITKPWELIFTQSPAAGTSFNADTNVTITVEDKSGNKSSCSFLVKLKTAGFDIDCSTAVINTNELNGKNGFSIYGEKAGSKSGDNTTPIGDINGDGIADFLVSAPGYLGMSVGGYVIFGKTGGFPANINLANLDGTNGFKIIDDDMSVPRKIGADVSGTRDINGDGIEDLMISDSHKSNGSTYYTGRVFVIYGRKSSFPETFALSTLDGSNGFKILGQTKDEFLGKGIANIGDFNNDSHSDIAIVSANKGSGNLKKCYIVFGRNTNFPSVINIENLDGSNSFIIEGDVGNRLSGLGDTNGDGIPDVIIAGEDSKYRYVVYGSSTLPAKLSTASINGTNGFKIENSATPLKTSEYFEVRGLGDVNGDNFNDIGINSYILFGKSSNSAIVDLKDLDGTNGFKINNFDFEYLHNYNSYGDFNNDGFDDILLPLNQDIYILYGKTNWSPSVTLNLLTSSEALKVKVRSASNYSLSFIGDVNSDSVDDIIIGTSKYTYTSEANEDPGISYVIFGKKFEDKEKPTIKKCPVNQVLAVNDPIPDYTKIVEIKDNCDVSPIITQFPPAATVFTGITQEVTITATDASGNTETCKFTITTTVIVDNEAPVLICPLDQQLPCGSAVIPDYTASITVTDNIDPSPVITQSPIPGSPFVDGMTITMTSKDASNNKSTCDFKVKTSVDILKPVVTCAGNQLLTIGNTLPDYSGLVTVTDNCDASPSITQNPAAGSAFVDGMTVEITVKDASNNESSCTFVVNAAADTEAPVVVCPSNQKLECGSVIPDYATLVTVTDNADPSPVVTQNPIAGSAFTDGVTVTITAKDASNNISDCSFKVNVAPDVVKPFINCIGSQSLSCSSILPDYTKMITAADNCDPSAVITQDPLPGTAFTEGMTVKITAKDASGNESICSFTINLAVDTTKPVITCISNQTVAANSILPDYRNQVIVTDNCDSNLTVIQIPAAGVTVSDGMTVQMSVSDNSGNTSACSFVINTIDTDTQAPVITCLPNQKVTCNVTKVPDFTTKVLVTDNKDPKPVIKQNPPAGSAFTDGMNITITATDASSNKSECSFKLNSDVVVVDAGNDIEIKQGEVVQLEAVATEEGTFKWSPVKGVSNPSSFNPFFSPEETTTYTVSFTNKGGCVAHDSVVISVIPKEKDETKYGFSPNSDGINDFWLIDGITEYPKNEVSIYNSWGDLVFQTTGYNNATIVFSGLANKKRNLGADELPEGTYFFEIKPNSSTHHFKKLKGYLVLKR